MTIEDDGSGPRPVSGWKATVVAITLIVVVFSVINLLARPDDPQPQRPRPTPSVVTATPH